MKRNTVKRMKQRGISLALALVLLGQTAPLVTFAADSQESAELLPQSTESEQTVPQAEEAPEYEPNAESASTEEEVQTTPAESEAEQTTEESAASSEQAVEEPNETDELPHKEEAEVPQSEADKGVVQITSVEQLLQGVPAESTYVLAADLTFNGDQQIGTVAGVLDGAGHTITINGKPMVKELTGTIQNLMVAGKASLQDGEGSIVCTINGGTLQNCRSTVAIDPGWAMNLGGLAGNVINGKIYNSYFAGTGKDMFGLVAINGIFYTSNTDSAPSQIKNCYYTEGNSIGTGSAWNRTDPSNGKKTMEEMQTPAFVELLNASNVGSGYIWAASEGELPHLIAGGGELEAADKTALKAIIDEAKSKHQDDYTGETWASMQKALTAAESVYGKIDATQAQVSEAEKALRDAMEALKEKERDLSPVEPPKNDIISVSSPAELAKIDGSNPKAFYQLKQDIVIEDNFVSPNLAGVLDGNGHTITLRTGSPLFGTILETGVVQNLQVKVEGNFTNRQEFAPFADKLKGGMIINCISQVTGQHSAGYVRRMEGGAMVNCLTMGHNRRGAFVYFQKSTDHQNIDGYKSGKFYNCYWSASNSVENITPAENLTNCKPLGDDELRSNELMDLLNQQKGAFGSAWGRDADGYPAFGKDHGEVVIDGTNNRYAVQFTWHDGQVSEVQEGRLQLSPQMTGSNRLAGTFQLKGVPEGSTIVWSCQDRSNQEIMQLGENGELHVFQDGGGVVRAMERKADGTQELAAELRVVSASQQIQELQLVLDGKVIQTAATIKGSGVQFLKIQAKYEGSEEFKPLPSYLVELKSEKPELLRTDYNGASFYFKEPGTSKLTVTEKTKKENPVSITVTITSEYVPVERVRPAISGTEKIHYRNSMGSGQFISLPQTVFVEPANASYKNDITVESSDPSVAQYDGSGYIPYKNGKVTFTAKLNDRGKMVEGKSDVVFVYENPLAEVIAPETKITLNQNEKQPLNLEFRGQPGNLHEITEPDLVWSFDKQGIVSIQRPDPLMQVRNTGGPDDGNWVASTKFEVKGLRAGTVTATGTPVDTTGGAKPVTLMITVKGDGSEVQAFDISAFIKKGKQAASNYLNQHNTFAFGEEWSIYALLRDNQTLPQDRLEQYYHDVVTNVGKWNKNVLPTEVERTIIALNILEKDIRNVGGVDLVKLICNHPNLTKQGSNALAWALIALDMNRTQLPSDAKWTREQMLDELLRYQNTDGGFSLNKNGLSEIDITAMSLQALAPYRDQEKMKTVIDRGMEYLEKAAEKNLNLGNSESIAQVVITLAVLERDIVEQPGFGDELENILSALSDYMIEGEGFRHDKKGGVDKMASAQAMQALCAYERFLNGESGYWDLNQAGPVVDPAQEVEKLIEALPESITLQDAPAVQAAREAYNRLTESQQQQVHNYAQLEAAEEKLRELTSVAEVEKLIEALPEIVTLKNEAAVQAARTAYDLLSESEKQQVSNVDRLLQAEQMIGDLHAAAKVENMIQELPNPVASIADKELVEAARSAYEALSATQQALVKNLDQLIRAEEGVKDLDEAQKVMELIKELPTELTIADEQAVQAARNAYQQLTEKQQTLVLNLYLLERAEQTMEDLKAVQAVEDAIHALPDTITKEDEAAIKAARAAYNQLSEELRSKVKNLDKLIEAERMLKALKRPIKEYTDILQTESNVIEAQVTDGVVDAKQLEQIRGKELILRIQGVMDSGEAYAMAIYGEDVTEVKAFKMGIMRSGLYTENIHKLAKECEIFRFAETGKFPGPMMVQMDTALENGAYLLFRYDPTQERAVPVSRVQVENGKVQFIVQEGGEYFLAKKASKKTVSELEEQENTKMEQLEEKAEPVKKTENAVQQTVAVAQPEQTRVSVWWIILPLLVVLAGGAVLVLKKRKEKKGE